MVEVSTPVKRGLHHRLYAWVLHWSAHPHARPALFLLALAESSFFPVPPDVLLISMSLSKPERARRFALICSVGSVVGGIVGYAIGMGLWHLLEAWFFRWLGPVGFTPENFATVQRAYMDWDFLAVFVAGFTPIPYKVFTIAAGVFGISFIPFVLASFLGRAGRFFLVAELVKRLGPPVLPFIERYLGWLTLLFGVLLIGGFAVLKLLH